MALPVPAHTAVPDVRSLPPAFSVQDALVLLARVHTILDTRAEWSSDELGEIAEAFAAYGIVFHDPGVCDVEDCQHHLCVELREEEPQAEDGLVLVP